MQDSTTRYDLHSSNKSLSAETIREEGYTLVKLSGKEYRVALKRTAPDILEGYVNDRPVSVKIEEETESSITLTIDGDRMVFERPILRPERGGGKSAAALPQGRNSLTSPMPGRVVALKVREGQSVAPGDPLMIVESMKMETLLTSDRNAVVGEVRVREGEAIRRGQTLIVYTK